MNRLRVAALAALVLTTSAVRADIPTKPLPPAPKVSEKAVLVVEVDDKATPATLEIPKSLLANLRASVDLPEGDQHASLGVSTVAAGLSLSLALAFGGVWLVRNRISHGGKNLALLIGAAALLAVGSTTVMANRAPPPAPKEIPAADGVVISIVNRAGAPVTLKVSKAKLTKAIEDAAAPK